MKMKYQFSSQVPLMYVKANTGTQEPTLPEDVTIEDDLITDDLLLKQSR